MSLWAPEGVFEMMMPLPNNLNAGNLSITVTNVITDTTPPTVTNIVTFEDSLVLGL